jgi:hypothetical protein
MPSNLNLADVPQIAASDLDRAMQLLIARGQGLALLKGLTEQEIRKLEDDIWLEFDGDAEVRLAVALRFRALLAVFTARRLKDLLLERGFKVIAAAIVEAARQRLNTRFGFNAQRLLLAVDAATSPARVTATEITSLRIAA